MALTDKKISQQEIDQNNVKSVVGNKLTGTVAQNKNVFDKLVEFVTGKYNSMIDEVVSTSGADNVGVTGTGFVGATVKAQLTESKSAIDLKADTANVYSKSTTDSTFATKVELANTVLGQIPDNSLTNIKLVNNTITNAKIANGTITATEIADGTVSNTELATDVKVGSLATLTTTAKTDVTSAINELDSLKGVKKTPTALQTASFTLDANMESTLQKCSSASTIEVLVPSDTTKTIAVGTEIPLARYGTGSVTFTKDSGVTVYSADSKLSIDKQYQSVVIKKDSTNTWLLIGALA